MESSENTDTVLEGHSRVVKHHKIEQAHGSNLRRRWSILPAWWSCSGCNAILTI